jgi:nucleoside-diphosphate-sugar epimerase
MTTEPSTAQAILVTGAAGFIASKVCELLIQQGYTVVGIDNVNEAYDTRLKEWRLSQIEQLPGFSFYRLDITDQESLAKVFEAHSFSAVINLAARAGVRQSVENPWVYIDTNVTGTLNLLELCRSHNIMKFVLASTSSLYGAHNPRPFREDADTNRALSPYAASKKAAEALCYTYHYLYNIDVTVLRYFTVYGPAGRPDMSLFRFIQWINEGRAVKIFGDGQQERDFTYVDDIARGTIAALQPVGYDVINLGSDTPIVLMNMVRLIEKLLGKSAVLDYVPRHPADVPATWADIGKAERILGWRPQCSFEEGVTNSVRWYQENWEWAKDIHTG